MNRVILMGRLTRDPDVKQTQAGNPMVRMNIAVDRRKSKSDAQQKADFPSLVAFGYTAEFCEKYLSKGKRILVEGRLQTGSYEKDGVTHYTTDIVCENIEFADSLQKGGVPTDEAQTGEENIPF